jgi:hypothetical protein
VDSVVGGANDNYWWEPVLTTTYRLVSGRSSVRVRPRLRLDSKNKQARPVDLDIRQLMEEATQRARKVVAEAPLHIVHAAASEHRRASRGHRRATVPT